MKAVVFYEANPMKMEQAALHYAAHRARLDAFHARGLVLMVGMFAKMENGAMGIFSNRQAAEEFMKEDPFLLNGVVEKWELRDWNEVLVPD